MSSDYDITSHMCRAFCPERPLAGALDFRSFKSFRSLRSFFISSVSSENVFLSTDQGWLGRFTLSTILSV